MFQVTDAWSVIASYAIMITVSPGDSGATVKMTAEIIVMKRTVPHIMVSHTKLITVLHDTVLHALLGSYQRTIVVKSLLPLFCAACASFTFLLFVWLVFLLHFQFLQGSPLSALVKRTKGTFVCFFLFIKTV